uniref:Putative LOC100908614 [Metaseiulus occidentalis] n=1 Tax=Lepeophtheirus salmonis TaxID=72036 RepID=A0A0K2V078_LEPSM
MMTLVKKTGNINGKLFLRAILEWRKALKDHRRSLPEILFVHQIQSVVPTNNIKLRKFKIIDQGRVGEEKKQNIKKSEIPTTTEKQEIRTPFKWVLTLEFKTVSMLWDLMEIVVERINVQTSKVRLRNGKILIRNRRFIKPDRSVSFDVNINYV